MDNLNAAFINNENPADQDRIEETLTPEDRYNFCVDWIQKIRQDRATLDSYILKAIKFRHSDPDILDWLEGRSKVTTTDVADAIAWTKPAILEIVAGSNDVVILEPEQEKYAKAVEMQELYVRHQCTKKNPWFLFNHDVLDEALNFRLGGAKYQFVSEEKKYKRRHTNLTDMEYQQLLLEAQQNPEATITSYEMKTYVNTDVDINGMVKPPITYHTVEITYTTIDEYVKLMAIPMSELLFPLDIKSVDDSPIMVHERRMYDYEVIDTYGQDFFDKIKDQHGEYHGNATQSREIEIAKNADIGSTLNAIDNEDKWIISECYFRRKDSGEPWVMVICGSEWGRDEYNLYERPPFECFTPEKLAHRMLGRGYVDILEQFQLIRTGLIRQIFDNLYQSNYRRYFVDYNRVDMVSYMNHSVTNTAIKVQGDPSTAVMAEERSQLPAETFTFWNLLLDERDFSSPVSRAYQGVDSSQLSKTYRGQNQQVTQTMQRVSMIARMYTETFLAPLVRDIIDCGIRFGTQKTCVKVTGQWVSIDPEDLIGRYTLTVNVGLGTSNKDNIITQMQQVLALLERANSIGIPIATAENWFFIFKEILAQMGYRNTTDFISDPATVQKLQTLVKYINDLSAQGMVQDANLMQLTQQAQEVIGNLGGGPVQQTQLQSAAALTNNMAQQAGPGTQPPVQGAQPSQPRMMVNGGNYFA